MLLTVKERVELGNILTTASGSIEDVKTLKEELSTFMPNADDLKRVEATFKKDGKMYITTEKDTPEEVSIPEKSKELLEKVLKEIDEKKFATVNALPTIELIEKCLA